MRTNEMQTELVVFDVAGTTVLDSGHQVAHALRNSMCDLGASVELRECEQVMGLSKPTALEALALGKVCHEKLDAFVVRAHSLFVDRMVHHYATHPGVRPVEDAESTFQILREEGIRIALNTGFSRPILDTILARLGWDEGVIDASISSDEVDAGRPFPFMIQRLMTKLGVATSARVMKVGDTVADIAEGLAAKAGGSIGVLSGTGNRAELMAAGATAILRDIGMLPVLIFGAMRNSEATRSLKTGSSLARFNARMIWAD